MNLPKEQQERLEELARKQNRSVHDLIMDAVTLYLNVREWTAKYCIDITFNEETPNGKPETDS